MKILLVVEHVRATPWSPSAWARDLGLALHARGHEVVVACDGVDDAADLAPLTILARTTPRRAEHRRPIAFGAWARRLVARGCQDVSVSLSPCVGADLWCPVEPGAAHYWRRLAARRNPASVAMGLTHTGWLPEAFVAEAIARGRGGRRAPIGVAPEEGGLGHASALAPIDDAARRALRWRTRALLEISPDRPVLVVSGVHHDSPGLDDMLAGLALAAGDAEGRTPLLLVLGREGYSVHARACRAGCEHLIRLLGGTRRVDAVLAASDVGVAPLARPAGTTSGRFVADCLRAGVPVVADRDAAGVALLLGAGDGPPGLVVTTRSAGAWREAIDRSLEASWRDGAAASARAVGATLSMDALVDRLEARLAAVR